MIEKWNKIIETNEQLRISISLAVEEVNEEISVCATAHTYARKRTRTHI